MAGAFCSIPLTSVQSSHGIPCLQCQEEAVDCRFYWVCTESAVYSPFFSTESATTDLDFVVSHFADSHHPLIDQSPIQTASQPASHFCPVHTTDIFIRPIIQRKFELKISIYHLDTDLNTNRHLVQDPIRDLNLGLSSGGGSAANGNGEQTGISSPRYGPEYRNVPRSRSHSRPQFGTLLWWRFRGLARTESKLGFYHLGTDLNTERHLVQDPIRDLNLGSPGLVSAARRGWREHWDFSKNEEMAMAVITIARTFSSLLPSLGK